MKTLGILEVNQIKRKLHEHYDGIINMGSIPSTREEEIEKNFLSKALAAYSINILYPQADKNEVVKYLVDGPDDNGIDLIYYNRDTNELCFVQSKFNGNGDSEPDLGEITKFIVGIKDLIALKYFKFNAKVNALKDEITEALNKSKVKFKIVLVYTAINLSQHSRREFDDLLAELNDFRAVADLEILNQKRVYSAIGSSNTSRNIDVEVQLKQWGRYEGEMEAFYGQISADQLCEWWENYGNSLYEYNLRRLLGNTDINNEMNDTLETEPELFWYYNNGITLVCEEVDKKRVFGNSRDMGVFECKGISIVNGAQTVGVIGKFGQSSLESKEKLGQVYLPFRIISMQRSDEEGEQYLDDKFAAEVTSKNNRQNRIENRDFVVLDEVQKKIERTLQFEGITYHLMRGEEDEVISRDSFSLREATRALSFAKDIEATILVSREIGLIYSDLNHARYKKLYNPSVTGYYVWNCVFFQRMVDDGIRVLINEVTDEKKAILVHGKELISKVVFDLIGSNNISKYEIGIENIQNIESLKANILDIVEEIIPIASELEKSPVNIFKSPNDIRSLYSLVIENLEKKNQNISQYTRGPVENEFDISLIGSLTRYQRVSLQKFYTKINEDDRPAKEFVQKWIQDIYDSSNHSFTYTSNIQFYYKDEEKAASDKFLFRIAYYTKLIVSFEFNVYGTNYRSVLLTILNLNNGLKKTLIRKVEL